MTGTSITLAGDVAAPATKLVERISDAIGGIAKPWQIKRVAQADAQAEVIRAEARLKITDLEQRAIQRMVREEAKKQENIESITEKSIPFLSDQADPSALDDDWIIHFFDKSRGISNIELQGLWARLLASEANNVNSVSRRTVEVVSTMDKFDAEQFSALAQFTITPKNDLVCISDVDNQVFKSAGLNFSVLSHLMDLGLIEFNYISAYIISQSQKQMVVNYHQHEIALSLLGEPPTMSVGQVRLTKAGKELLMTIPAVYNHAYYIFLIEKWSKDGYSPVDRGGFITVKR